MRTVYVNGEYVAESEAKVSIFDRGFLFADAIYEVTTVVGGKLIDFEAHMSRLRRSLGELNMASPASDDELRAMHLQLIERNQINHGLIYMQVTRGVADRDFLFPEADTPPTLIAFTQVKRTADIPALSDGIAITTAPDKRWGRRDIKTVQLLWPSMVKMEAHQRGADDAWMFDEDGMVTEGTSNNAFIVTAEGTIVTRELSNDILHGTVRKALLACADSMQMKVEERPFSVEEAKAAKEAFVSSSGYFGVPVVKIDDATVADGKRGPVTKRLQEAYFEAKQLES